MSEIIEREDEQEQNGATLNTVTDSEDGKSKPWAVRLDRDMTAELDALMAREGISNKRDLLKYLTETAKTAELKSRSKGNENLVTVIEDSLGTLRSTLNTLLENNLQVEEITRNKFISDIERVENKKNAVQEKLNRQLDVNKELEDKIQKLEVEIANRDEQIGRLESSYQDTKELNVSLKKIVEKQETELKELAKVEGELKELRSENARLEAELKRVNVELKAKDEEIQNKNNMITVMGEENQKLADANVALKEEYSGQVARYMNDHSEELDRLKDRMELMKKDYQKQMSLMEAEHKLAMSTALLEKDSTITSLKQEVREAELAAREEVQRKSSEFANQLAEFKRKHTK